MSDVTYESTPKILIAEDDATVAVDLVSRLNQLGYEVCGKATTSAQALELIEQRRPGLVLLDVLLRGDTDGITTAETIRRRYGIPLVFLAADADPDLLERAKWTDPFGFLFKPVQDRELKTTIEMALHAGQLEAERKQKEAEHQRLEIKYHTLFREMLDGFALHEIICNEKGEPTDYRFLAVNPAFEKMTGMLSEQVEGKTVLEVMPDTEPYWLETYGRVALTGDPVFFQNYSQALDKYFEVTAFQPAPNQFACIFQDITAHKKAEKALRKSEDRYRLIADNTSDSIWAMDRDLHFTYLSPSTETLFGYSLEEWENLVWEDFVHPDHLNAVLEAFNQLRDAQRDAGITTTAMVRHKNGRPMWVEYNVTPIKGASGEFLGAVGVTRDVTERKRTEEALEKRMIALTRPLDTPEGIAFRDLFNLDAIQLLQDQFAEATGVASIITHTDGTPITRPSHFCRLCRDIIRKTEKGLLNCYQSDAVLGKHSSDGPVIKPCLSGGLWDAGAGISVGGKHIANWVIGQIRNETQTDARMRAYAREIGADEDAVLHAFHEVPSMDHEQFRAVAQVLFTLANQLSSMAYQNVQQARFICDIKQKEEELRKSEEKYRAIFENKGTATGTCGDDGVITSCNAMLSELLGYPKEDIVNKKRWLDFIGEEDRSGMATRHLDLAFQTNSLPPQQYECWVVHKSGKRKRVTVNIGMMENLRIVSLTDITDRVEAEAEKATLQNQLQQAQKMEAIGTLAGGISHDFNNLLQAISGYTELLLMNKANDDPDFRSLKAIQKAGSRASGLIQQLLLFSRKKEISKKACALQKDVEHARKMLERTIPKMVRIQVNTGSRLWPVMADSVQIEQMLLNLATNAADAMPEGGTLLFEIENTTLDDDYAKRHLGAHAGNYVLLTVSDTGQGMDKETMGKIFEPFFTTKPFGKGTGLGLASVYGIVKGHGGYITCYSEIGQGTTFKIYFPALEHPAVPKYKPIEVKPSSSGNETILLVDDEEAIRSFAEQVLLKYGYQVLTASTGEEALEQYQAKSDEIDLILLDLGMPGMGGHQCLQRLVQIDQEVKVIIASGYAINGQVKQSVETGAAEYIGKPYKLDLLLKKVREVLDQKR